MKDKDLVGAVREHLSECDLKRCRRRNIADQVGTSNTMLGKHLAQSGVKFAELLEAERMARCERLMRKHGRHAYGKVLASELGYREVNSFYRAFRRWYGVHFCGARMGRPTA